jgi:hypothetical protein
MDSAARELNTPSSPGNVDFEDSSYGRATRCWLPATMMLRRGLRVSSGFAVALMARNGRDR